MFSFPISFFFLIYLLFALVLFIFICINVYHLSSTASLTMTSIFVSLIVIGLFFGTLLMTAGLLQGVSWQTPITLFEGGSDNSTIFP